MRKKIIGILVCMLLIGATNVAVADWKEGDGHKMHFPQLPDPFGFDVDFGRWKLGDDWKCSESGLVTDIHFWISFMDDVLKDPEWIKCEIWSNEPNGPMGYSIPAELLWEQVFFPDQFIIAGPWSGEQRWFMPWGEIIPIFHNLYWQVNIPEIDDPFEQTEGEIYWLVIKMSFEEEFIIGWKNTQNYYMDHAVWLPEGENWTMIDGIDFAFVITGGPPPKECCLVIESMSGGLFGTPSTLNVNAVIKNTGDAECRNITWSITSIGGIVLWGPKAGTISSILPGATASVSSRIFIGLAIPGVLPCNVTISADCPNNVCGPATMSKQIFLFLLLLSVF